MIVGLTSAARVNPYAALVLDELARRQVPARFVLSSGGHALADAVERLDRRGWAGAWGAVGRRLGRGHHAAASPLAEVGRGRGLDLQAPLARVCGRAGVEVVRVEALNSPAAAVAVKARETDVLVNTGGGLFRSPLLEAPAAGMLNAHMARLPQLRGVDALEWSLLLGVEPGVTVHWIDAGVDTGRTLAFEALSPRPGDTLEGLREQAVRVSAWLLAEQVARLARGEGPRPAQQRKSPPGTQYFALHPRLRALAAAKLAPPPAD